MQKRWQTVAMRHLTKQLQQIYSQVVVGLKLGLQVAHLHDMNEPGTATATTTTTTTTTNNNPSKQVNKQ